MTDSGCVGEGHVLAQTADFTVRAEYEVVWLESSHFDGAVVIGDFYGGPAAAAIDREQRWCVVVGEYLLAYRLAPPWQLDMDPADPSWTDGSDAAKFGQVWPGDDGTFVCTTGPPDGDDSMTVARVDPDRRQITVVAHVTDRDTLDRTGTMASLVDGQLRMASGDEHLRLEFLNVDYDEPEVEITAGLAISFPSPPEATFNSASESAARLVADHLDWTVLEARAQTDGSCLIRLVPPSVPGRSVHPPPEVLLRVAPPPDGAWRVRVEDRPMVVGPSRERRLDSPASPQDWQWEPTTRPPGLPRPGHHLT